MKIKNYKILILLFLFAFIFANQKPALDGKINLKSVDFQNNLSVDLDGKWNFYWNELLTPDSFIVDDAREHLNIDIPFLYNFVIKEYPQIKPQGYCTYRLQITLKNGSYFIMIPPIHSAMKIWINGDNISSFGTIGTSKNDEYPNTKEFVVPVIVKNEKIDLIINNSNFHHNRGGLVKNIKIGESNNLFRSILKYLIFDLSAFLVILIIGIFHIGTFFLKNEESNLSNLLFGILSIFLSIRLLLVNSSIFFIIFPSINWLLKIQIEWISSFVLMIFAILYIIKKYPDENNKVMDWLLITIGISTILVFLIVDPIFITGSLLFIYTYALITMIYLFIVLYKAFINKREDSRVTFFGMILFIILLIFEFYYTYIIGIYINFIVYGFMVLFIGHAVNLIVRLRKMSRRIDLYKNHLEEIIKNRTRELEESKIQLEAKIHQVLLSQGKLQEINDRLSQQIKITKTAQNATLASEIKFREMAELLPEMVYETDNDLNFTYVNQRAIELFGYTLEEFSNGLNARQLLDEGYIDKLLSTSFNPSNNILQKFTDFKFKTKDGNTFWGWINGKAIVKDNSIIGFRGIVVDITQLRLNDIKIKKLQDFLFNIIDSMPSILIGINSAMRITLWNKSASKYYAKNHKTVHRKHLYEICKDLEKYDKKIVKGIETNQINSFKIERDFDDIKKHENLTIYPLMKTNDGAVIRIDDITEQVKMQELLVQSEKMLSIGGLAAGMAHEINNPLAGMIQNASVISNRMKERNIAKFTEDEQTIRTILQFMTDRKIDKLLGLIIESGHRAAQIVDNMLSFAKQGKLVKSEENINSIINDTLNIATNDYNLDKKFDFKKIIIKKNLDEKIPTITCEKSKIQQVIFNLIKNSAEATHEKINLPKFVPEIEIITRNMFRKIKIEIKDNGAGIPSEVKNRIFEPFFTTKPTSSGTGLGLSVSYFIITKNHNGEMYVDSISGQGTTFTILLPIEDNISID